MVAVREERGERGYRQREGDTKEEMDFSGKMYE